MIKIEELITKLEEIKTFYPDIPVDVDKIVIHVGLNDSENICLKFTKV